MVAEWMPIAALEASDIVVPNVIAVDIGGSSVKACLTQVAPDSLRTLSPGVYVRQLQGRTFSELRGVVEELIQDLYSRYDGISAIGVSTTGSVDNSGLVVSAGHFDGYKNVNWKANFERIVGRELAVAVLNDGRASCWAEYRANARRVESHVHAVVGTGVGGGLVVNGKLLAGDSGQAGYIGHMKITFDPTAVCSCGAMGCVETLAAAPAIVRLFNCLSAESPEALNFDEVHAKARAGDKKALQAMWDSGLALGIGLGSAMNVINPSVVTVGGGVVNASFEIDSESAGDPYFSGFREGISRAAHRRVIASADIRRASFGNESGMFGAAMMAHSIATSSSSTG